MEREIDLKEISDGKLYSSSDMVKADCGDCKGCSACCQGMGSSILLDPYDIYRLSTGTGLSFEDLLKGRIELNMSDGLILPNLKMAGEKEACSFLNEEGRCSVHSFRPGFCRLFPLGRLYENGSFQYFLQIHECKKENRTKVKIRKWIDVPDFGKYEKFVSDWHYFAKEMGQKIKSLGSEGQDKSKALCLYVLKKFYMEPFDASVDFYEQFNKRLEEAKHAAAA